MGYRVTTLVTFLHSLGWFSITGIVVTLVGFLHTLGGFSSFNTGQVVTYTGWVLDFYCWSRFYIHWAGFGVLTLVEFLHPLGGFWNADTGWVWCGRRVMER